MRRAVLALTLLAAAGSEAAEPDVQVHEVDASVDVDAEEGANTARIDGQYTFSPAGIDRTEETPAFLRRFLDHPSALWVHIRHEGGTRETITTATVGGELDPANGVVYGRFEGGAGRRLTTYDEPNQFGYWFYTFTAEVGFRPVNLVQIGAFYHGEPIFDVVTDDTLFDANQTHQSGLESRAGATVSFVTPGQRLYGTVTGFAHLADWSYTFGNPGDITVRGLGGTVRLAILLTRTTTLQLRGAVARDHWVDDRTGDSQPFFVGPDLDRQVWTTDGGVDLFYWQNGRYGFRVSAGGGYRGSPTLTNSPATGLFDFGGGLLLRF